MKNIPIILALIVLTAVSAHAGNQVRIIKTNDTYKLYINGRETVIKGVGCGYAFGTNGENYIRMAKELGADSVRTWGVDQGDDRYLAEAFKQGLYVDAGLWLNPVYPNGVCSYITDLSYRNNVRSEILDYVRKNKDNPSIIFWNVGNEVFVNIKEENEKVAFAKFLNGLVRDIKAIDPDHPTIYTSAGLAGLKYIIDYVPEIDIFGINLYGGIAYALKTCRDSKLNRPVIITELGPVGYWDVTSDKNNIPIDQNDGLKAATIRNYLKETEGFGDILLGTYIFHLGETSQDSVTWWNLNYGNTKRAQFWEIYKIYTGKPAPVIPKITRFALEKTSSFTNGEWVETDLSVSHPRPEELKYEFFASTTHLGAIAYYVNRKIPLKHEIRGDSLKVRMPDNSGVLRIYAVVSDREGNSATLNVSANVK